MTTPLTLRSVKGSPLTSPEIDGNFTALRTTADAAETAADAAAYEALLAGDTGASQIGYLAPYTGAVARTQASKNADAIDFRDFAPVGDGSTSDDAKFTSFLTAISGKHGHIGPAPGGGGYRLTSAHSIPANTKITGCGYAGRLIQTTNTTDTLTPAGANITIDGLWLVGTNTTANAIFGQACDGITIQNCVFQNNRYGIRLAGCSNRAIKGNTFFGGTADTSSSSDIFIYGSAGTPSHRTIISNNFCLSINDVGINVDSNDGDREVLIQGNIVACMDSTGLAEIADGSNTRRYGIAVGYVGGNKSRCVVSGNIVSGIPYSGIYQNAATLPSGDVSITGNTVARCGWGTLYPADASLRAGIFSAGSGSDNITGNEVVDCTTAGIKVAPSFVYSSTNQPRSLIGSNVVARVTGRGIWLTGKPHGYLVQGNRVINPSADAGIYYESTSSDGGNCSFKNNHIDIGTAGVTGMLIDNSNGGNPCDATGNTIKGANSATTGEFNSGIWFLGKVHCSGNTITNFWIAIKRAATVSSRSVSLKGDNNAFTDCLYGIHCPGDGPWIVQGNTFDNVTTHYLAAPWQGTLLETSTNGTTIITSGTAAPTVGTWAIGDQVVKSNATVGQPKGWTCTTAGTPGTWTSQGNL